MFWTLFWLMSLERGQLIAIESAACNRDLCGFRQHKMVSLDEDIFLL